MDPIDKEFWSAITPEGGAPVDLKTLYSRLDDVLEANPSWIQIEGASSFALYSGPMDDGSSSWKAANDLADKSDGAIGIIDRTRTGQALGDFATLAKDSVPPRLFDGDGNRMDQTEFDDLTAKSNAAKAELRANYGEYIDLKDMGTPEFTNGAFDAFDNPSKHFAQHAHGNVMTLTENADEMRAFGRMEAPGIADGLSTGRIETMNSFPASDMQAALDHAKLNDFKPITPDVGGTLVSNPHGPIIDEARVGIRAKIAEAGSLEEYIDNASSEALAARTAHQDSLKKMLDADASGDLRSFTEPDGNSAIMLDSKSNSIIEVAIDADNGTQRITNVTEFADSDGAGKAFGRMLGAAAESGDLPDIHRGLSGLASHLDNLKMPNWAQDLANVAGEGGKFLGKASKILGPLGVAAAGAEAYALEMKLQDMTEFGLVPEDAMLAYRGILTAHTAQATVDPTLVGGELVTQKAFDEWVEHYGVADNVAKELEPGSLLEDGAAAAQWVTAHAEAAGKEVADYATSRYENPEMVLDDLKAVHDSTVAAVSKAAEIGWDATVDAAEAVGDYASDRWENPGKLLDDAEAVTDRVGDAASTAASTVGGWGTWVWNKTFGDEPEATTDHGITDPASEPRTRQLDLNEAYEQLREDAREVVSNDPGYDTALAKALAHPDATGMFNALDNAGVRTIDVTYPDDASASERAAAIMSGTYSQLRERGLDIPQETAEVVQREVVSQPHVQEEDVSAGL